jgi:hypothetical protein
LIDAREGGVGECIIADVCSSVDENPAYITVLLAESRPSTVPVLPALNRHSFHDSMSSNRLMTGAHVHEFR